MADSSAPTMTVVSVDDVEYSIALPDAGTDYIQGQITRTRIPYEHDMLEAMAARLQQGDLVLDIGANIGNHTLFLAAVPRCRVIAYEPSEHLTNAIRDSVAANGFQDRISIRCAAVSDVAGDAVLVNADPSNLGGQHVDLDTTAEGQATEVIRLDDELPDQRVAAIKVDVEGFEVRVLRGAEALIERDHPDIWIECLSWKHFEDVSEVLGAHGYRFYSVHNPSPTHLFVHDETLSPEGLALSLTALLHRFYKEYESFTTTRSSLHAANARYRGVTEQYQRLKDSSARDHDSLVARLDEAREALPGDKRRLVERLDDAARLRDEANDRARGLERELAELTVRHSELALTLRDRSEAFTATIDDLRSRITLAQKRQRAAEKTRGSALVELERRLTATAEERAAADAEARTALAEEHAAECENLRSQHRAALEAQASELERVRTAHEAEATELRSRILDTESDRDRLRDEAAAAQGHLEGTRAELAAISDDRVALGARLDESEAALGDVTARCRELEARQAELHRENATVAARAQRAEEQLRATDDELSTARDRLLAAGATITALTAKQARQRSDFNYLRAHVTERADEVDALHADIEARDTSIAERDAEIEALTARGRALHSERDRRGARIEELTEQLADRDAVISSLTKELHGAQDDVKARAMREKNLRASKTYRVGTAVREAGTWNGFWRLAPDLIAILSEKTEEKDN